MQCVTVSHRCVSCASTASCRVLGSDFVKQVREEMPGYTYETLQYVVDTYDRLDQDGSGTIDNAYVPALSCPPSPPSLT